MKREIKLWDYAGQILEGVQKAALVTTKADGKVNAMTIGWGTLGIEWSKPVFILFVRESRYTMEMLQKNPEFTINVPLGDVDKNILKVCGTRSGRDMDKIKELNLTLEEGKTVSVPAIKELPLTLECKVRYQQPQDPNGIPQDITEHHYPRNATFPKGDYHTAYYGEITAAYIVE
ncbi:MAG: flavin reductase family protein [Oscillospiraceae bacterium]|nr:flavin reductase family protein [Oscillospiraceae bacterium]